MQQLFGIKVLPLCIITLAETSPLLTHAAAAITASMLKCQAELERQLCSKTSACELKGLQAKQQRRRCTAAWTTLTSTVSTNVQQNSNAKTQTANFDRIAAQLQTSTFALGPCRPDAANRLGIPRHALLALDGQEDSFVNESAELPDHAIIALLKREHLLTRAKLNALYFEHVTGERRLRSLKTQLRQVSLCTIASPQIPLSSHA